MFYQVLDTAIIKMFIIGMFFFNEFLINEVPSNIKLVENIETNMLKKRDSIF